VSSYEESIEVNHPVRTVYDQWTQFESFPHFMKGVERIDQQGPTMTHWVTKVAGVEREFDAEITEQTPDQRIAWKSVGDGPSQAGVVTFHRIDDGRTKIMLQLELQPEGPVEKAGDKLGLVDRQVKGDLERFKTFLESQGSQTGSWRGEVGQEPTR